MGITHVMGLLGGLALFLYGMQMMSMGMEAAAGSRMKEILKKLTANRFLGVLVGAVITAIIQSSSATTVMVVGFVNSGMMTLRQAVWIIMGANIGTTITGQLIALDVGEFAPLVAFIGVVLIVFIKKEQLHHIGSILAGLGILFIGMGMMSDAMVPLQDSKIFIDMMTKFSNPLLGILAGAVFTAIIQSSSASVGILQVLASNGIIPFSSAVYVLFGQNIGTCITALLASIGTKRNAKRTTIIHLSFNIIGTVVFTALCITTPLISFVEKISPDSAPAQIANMHTFFNIATTLLLLPFGNYLAAFAEKILPKTEEECVNDFELLQPAKSVTEHSLGISAIGISQVQKSLQEMLKVATGNVMDGFDAFIRIDDSQLKKVEENEETVDIMNKKISKYVSEMMKVETDEKSNRVFRAYFNITGNIERISDHAMNICGYSRVLKEKQIQFSEAEHTEVENMKLVCKEMLENLIDEKLEAFDLIKKISAFEQRIDDLTQEYRNNMLQRMKTEQTSQEGCIFYSEMLTDFERIGDHALNISEQLADALVVL